MNRMLKAKRLAIRKAVWSMGAFALSMAILLSGCSASGSKASDANRQESASTEAAQSIGDPAGNRDLNQSHRAENGNPSGETQPQETRSQEKKTATPSESSNRTYDDTTFEHAGINPFLYTDEEPVSTFAIDVDTASYTISRNYIQNGTLPPPEAVRVEEFINYFRREYQTPARDTFSIYTEIAPSYFGKGCHLLEVGLQGKIISEEQRKDVALTFVIDVSGSMKREDRLELVKKSLRLLVEQMRDTDRIGIAVYGTHGRTLINHTDGDNKRKILDAINRLRPEGSTNAEEGLKIGYDMASRAFLKNGVNRVILCTDGVANQGNTEADEILKTIENRRAEGITLTCLGFGMENYNDVLLEQLADKGDGSYAYIDTLEEAKKIFLEGLMGTLQVIAKNVKAQVEFDPDKVERYRLIGYENRHLNNEDFRNDSVDAGEVGAGHAVTALYEVELRDEVNHDIGIIRVRYQDPQSGETGEIYKRVYSSEVTEHFQDATPRFRFLAAVAETAEILRGSRWSRTSTMKDVRDMMEDLRDDLQPNRTDEEFVELVRKAAIIQQ